MLNCTQEIIEVPQRPPDPVASGDLLGGTSPRDVVQRGAAIADQLIEVVKAKKLYTKVGGRPYMLCDGWLALAGMLGAVPRVVSVVEADGEFTAEAELVRALDGAVIGRGFGSCGTDEAPWKRRPRYARRAMAQTRAIARACRSLSWIPRLAGLSSTAAEEIEADAGDGDGDHLGEGDHDDGRNQVVVADTEMVAETVVENTVTETSAETSTTITPEPAPQSPESPRVEDPSGPAADDKATEDADAPLGFRQALDNWLLLINGQLPEGRQRLMLPNVSATGQVGDCWSA